MCATLKGISHREVLNAASREANGIKMPQRTRDSSQKQFAASRKVGFPFRLRTLSKLHIFVVALSQGSC